MDHGAADFFAVDEGADEPTTLVELEEVAPEAMPAAVEEVDAAMPEAPIEDLDGGDDLDVLDS